MRKKVLFFFFLIAEDTIDTAIDINNLQSEADSDQLSHISNGWVSAPNSLRNSREIQGVPMCSSCLTLHLQGLSVPPAGLAGQTLLLKWRGKHRSASPHPALKPHQHLNAAKDRCCFCLDDFTSLCSSDRHTALHTPGSCSRGGHQKGCCALCNEKHSSWHSTLQLAWLQLGLLEMLHPAVLSQLIDQESQHQESAPRRLSHSWSDQLLTLGMSPPHLLNAQTRRA